MTSLIKVEGRVRRPSKQRPKSLILSINPLIKELMGLDHNTKLTIEVCLDENNKKFVKIRKKD